MSGDQEFCFCTFCFMKGGFVVPVEFLEDSEDWAICMVCGSSHAHDMETI